MLTNLTLEAKLVHLAGVRDDVTITPIDGSVLVDSEDGFLYRWDLVTGGITQRIRLGAGIGES